MAESRRSDASRSQPAAITGRSGRPTAHTAKARKALAVWHAGINYAGLRTFRAWAEFSIPKQSCRYRRIRHFGTFRACIIGQVQIFGFASPNRLVYQTPRKLRCC
jgi:hypothetical protein